MIITKIKELEDIIKNINKKKKLFLVGCSACATKCQTGGEKEALAFKSILEEKGYEIEGYKILDTPCDARIVKKDLMSLIKDKDIQLIVLACGSGVQTIRKNIENDIVSALNTVYIGSTKRIGEFFEYCKACGDCKLDEFDNLCSNTRCPKSTMNAPCGDVFEGKCGTNDNYCIWYLIYEKKKSIGGYKEPRKYGKDK